jgi:FAD-dependent oxidoreductase family protein
MTMRTISLIGLLAALATAETRNFDVVVYGGTAGGAIAAVSAARQGLKTALVEPTGHIGGMVSGGLGWTDYGRKEVIGGYALEFYWRVGAHYQMGRYGNDVAWLHEPHVAEAIFRDMLREAGVSLFEHQRLREKSGVRKDGARVAALTMEDGTEFTAAVFIDAGYEGDVMAQSGVTWTLGRESSAQYGESLAGVRERTPLHQFLVDISPRDEHGKLLPEISTERPGPHGSADKRVQAYNFRLCFSDDRANQAPFPKPAGYDPARYALLARLIAAVTAKDGKPPALGTLMKIDRLPNGKTDVNNNGAFSTDYLGGSWNYPNASYREREAIWQAHKDYVAGFLYFLADDPQVPEALRAEMNRWGLARDEFGDTGNWPRQLYIREARRMVGEYVMVQKDLQTELTKPDPIGMGSYNSDSHNVERIVDESGFVRNEGDMQVAVKPYQIPYRVMLPRRAEARNLLVTAAFSASHVAYSSVRMEPQYMIIGQAAGVAAGLAIRSGKAVQEIDREELTGILHKQGAVMEYVPNPQAPVLQIIRRR